MAEQRISHRTRSKAAPDWSAEESLILINEINAIESEWGAALPSYQKWKQIVDNCNSLDVNRNLNQCRRKWDELFSEYRRVKNGSGGNGSLHGELFDAIDQCVSAKEKRSGSEVEDEGIDGLEAAKLVEDDEEEQAVMETDPDSDPEAQGRVTKFFFETGSKKQKRRMKRQKRRIEKLNPWGYFTSPKVKLEEWSNINGKLENTNSNIESLPESTIETKEQIMCTILRENAFQINALLECNIAVDADYKLADLKNAEAVQTDLTRQQGDKLIVYLEKISRTLKDFSDLVEHNSNDVIVRD